MHNETAHRTFHPPDRLPDTTEPAPDNSGFVSPADFPPGYVERAAAAVKGGHEAASDPLPGPLLAAFLPESLRAAGFELRPVVASDWAVLKRIQSPLLTELKRASLLKEHPELATEKTTFSEEEMWELLYLWTHSPRESRALLAKGPEAYREAAMQVADKLSPRVINEAQAIVDALFGNLLRSLSTQVGHAPAGDDGPGFPLAPPQTASAGGSTMSGR